MPIDDHLRDVLRPIASPLPDSLLALEDAAGRTVLPVGRRGGGGASSDGVPDSGEHLVREPGVRERL